ncbi:unnamed protein product [Calypogeia fissa]
MESNTRRGEGETGRIPERNEGSRHQKVLSGSPTLSAVAGRRRRSPGGSALCQVHEVVRNFASNHMLSFPVGAENCSLIEVPLGTAQMLSDAGFADVVAEDRTDQFVEILKAELEVTRFNRDQFIADFSEHDYNYIVDGWEAKLKRCGRGEQKWGLFVAAKTK